MNRDFPWKTASLSQLYCIAYADDMATPVDRQQAVEEIRRRLQAKKRHVRVNYREKKVYPR